MMTPPTAIGMLQVQPLVRSTGSHHGPTTLTVGWCMQGESVGDITSLSAVDACMVQDIIIRD